MKKKILLFVVFIICIMFAPSVLAVDIKGCESLLPNISIDAKIPNTVHTAIVVIKIAVPVLLVIFGMLDLFKGITAQKEDEIKKGQQIFIKRLIAAAIIFFVVSIVQLIISFVTDAGNEKSGILECFDCFINGADENGNCKK